MAVNVRSTHTAVCEGMSRNELLAWVNDKLKSKFTKVDELCTGAAYCQLVHALFPNHVPMKRVKFYTNIEREFIDNFKILQIAFQRLRVDKTIPIERLCRGKFQDNIEFLQWFKKFYDANDHKNFYDPLTARFGLPMGYGALTAKRNIGKRQKTILTIWDKPSEKDEPVADVVEHKPQSTVSSSSETLLVLKRSLTRTEFRKVPLKTTESVKDMEITLLKKEQEMAELKLKLSQMKLVETNRKELFRRIQHVTLNNSEVENLDEFKIEILKILKEFGEVEGAEGTEKYFEEDHVENYIKDDDNCEDEGVPEYEIEDKEIYVDANEIDFDGIKSDVENEVGKFINEI